MGIRIIQAAKWFISQIAYPATYVPRFTFVILQFQSKQLVNLLVINIYNYIYGYIGNYVYQFCSLHYHYTYPISQPTGNQTWRAENFPFSSMIFPATQLHLVQGFPLPKKMITHHSHYTHDTPYTHYIYYYIYVYPHCIPFYILIMSLYPTIYIYINIYIYYIIICVCVHPHCIPFYILTLSHDLSESPPWNITSFHAEKTIVFDA